jgi:hypothetical protein
MGEIAFNGHFAQQQSGGPKCREGSKASFSVLWSDVRYYPESDHDSDLAGGRLSAILDQSAAQQEKPASR